MCCLRPLGGSRCAGERVHSPKDSDKLRLLPDHSLGDTHPFLAAQRVHAREEEEECVRLRPPPLVIRGLCRLLLVRARARLLLGRDENH